MSSFNFPPAPIRKEEIAVALGILTSLFDQRDGVYVSAPITSGKRYSDWHRIKGKHLNADPDKYEAMHLSSVVEPNRRHAKGIVKKVRDSFPDKVIDPTAVEDFPGWTQSDYRYFWGRVIEKFVHKAVFVNGWHYSLGCSYEFLISWQSGVIVLDEYLKPLDMDFGISLIRDSIVEFASSPESALFLEGVVNSLNELKQDF